MPAQPRVGSGKAMSMVEEGSLIPSLLAGAIRGEDWTKSSNRAALTKLRVLMMMIPITVIVNILLSTYFSHSKLFTYTNSSP